MPNIDQQIDPFLSVPGAIAAIDYVTDRLLAEPEPISTRACMEQEAQIKQDAVKAGMFADTDSIQTKLFLAFNRGIVLAEQVRLSLLEPNQDGSL